MKSWRFLRPGDLVDIVAPGSSTTQSELDLAIQFLKSWGLKTRVREPLFSGHPYVANDIKKRSNDLKKALMASDSRAIWCLRGGYGALQLVSELKKIKVAPSVKSKLLIGYSDISTLHLWFNQSLKWTSCHGPLLDGMGKNKHQEKDVRELYNLLFGVQTEITFDGLIPQNKAALKVKNIEAPLMAGNLVVLASSLGSDLELKTTNKILCLEEIGERGYRVDRLLCQLENSKSLKGCQAILLGDFLGGDEPLAPNLLAGGSRSETKNFVHLALQSFIDRQSIPVFAGLQMGHGLQNRPLFLGPKAVLQQETPRKGKTRSPAQLVVRSGGVE